MNKNSMIEESIKRFCDHLEMDYQVNFIKKYAKIGDHELYGGKHCGSDAEHEGSAFIKEKLEELGLDRVELIPCSTSRYQFHDAALTITGENRVIRPYGYVSAGTDEKGITAPLIDVKKSVKEVYKICDANDKIVLLEAMGALESENLAGQIEEAVIHGARAIVIYATEDILNDETIRVQTPSLSNHIPIVGICKKDADYIKEQLKQKGNLTANLTVDAEFIPGGGTTYNVVGEIFGTLSEEAIVYSAHLDHFFRCLQDNMASCATLLGIAKAIKTSGYTPARSIIFAFHGSHETGESDTRYPYIYGSYKLVHEAKPDWKGKVIANINFEYTALSLKELKAVGCIGSGDMLRGYFPYAPKLIGGFGSKSEEIDDESYYLSSWCDGISYHSEGIPTLGNDIITEQMEQGESPYIGRDHSNHDNWDIFEVKALEDSARFYGGLGIYLDQLPYVNLNFSEQAQRIRKELNRELLNDLGVSYEAYFAAIDELEKEGQSAAAQLAKNNRSYLDKLEKGLEESERRKHYDEGRKYNIQSLRIYELFSREIDKINQFDFLCLGSAKYAENIEALSKAIAFIRKGDLEKAMEEGIACVDLALASYYFSEQIVEHMRAQICSPEYADKRTWARGREVHVSTCYNLVNHLLSRLNMTSTGFNSTLAMIKAGLVLKVKPLRDRFFRDTISEIEAVIEEEKKYLAETMANEKDSITKAVTMLNKF